ncbi:MAG: hypothetical protein Q7S39_04305 [Ignavibacteria bacterium]|nr:hypothetical protein [Ignavibacteria bacterium]
MIKNNQLQLDKAVAYNKFDEVKRWTPCFVMLPVMIWLVLNRGEYSWIDNADLLIHEAGHFFFMVFGKFIYTSGGTLMQIILPSLIGWYFFRNSYRTGVQFSLLWPGQNFINISVYAADARAQMLPLLGGNKVYHDWHYLLGELNILQFDSQVGYFFFGIAVIVFIITLILPLIIHN